MHILFCQIKFFNREKHSICIKGLIISYHYLSQDRAKKFSHVLRKIAKNLKKIIAISGDQVSTKMCNFHLKYKFVRTISKKTSVGERQMISRSFLYDLK